MQDDVIMETFSALLTFCAVNSHVTGEFPTQIQVKRSFGAFFDLRLNNGCVNNRDAGDLRRHRAYHDVTIMVCLMFVANTLPNQSSRIVNRILPADAAIYSGHKQFIWRPRTKTLYVCLIDRDFMGGKVAESDVRRCYYPQKASVILIYVYNKCACVSQPRIVDQYHYGDV